MCFLAMIGYLSAIDTKVAIGLVDSMTEIGIHWCSKTGDWCNERCWRLCGLRDQHLHTDETLEDNVLY
jgi:hypothetical protein